MEIIKILMFYLFGITAFVALVIVFFGVNIKNTINEIVFETEEFTDEDVELFSDIKQERECE